MLMIFLYKHSIMLGVFKNHFGICLKIAKIEQFIIY